MQTENRMRGRAVVAHRAHNPEVVGSNPAPATFFLYRLIVILQTKSSALRPMDNQKNISINDNSAAKHADSSVNVPVIENTGRVISSTGSFYTVKCEDGQTFNCVVKGKFRTMGIKTTNPVAVGDMVHFVCMKGNQYGQIDRIDDRKNCIIRKSVNLSKQYSVIASNIDMAYLIVSCKNPQTDTMFIDRFLVTANAYNVPCSIIINKTDIYDSQAQQYAGFLIDIYENIGYNVFLTSVVTGTGLEKLRKDMSGKICLFSGNSGVGKSSLINLFCPDAKQKTADISATYLKGKHTTTFAAMFTNGDINIIDTPGIKSFGMADFKREELALYFPEMKERLQDCKYYNCTHTHEPHCAIKKAAKTGEIHYQRYNNYIKLLNAEDMSPLE